MIKQHARALFALAFLFFVPRIAFLYWGTHHSPAHFDNAISHREPTQKGDGLWAGMAQNILNKQPLLTSDDVGFPYLMAALGKAGVPLRSAFYVGSFLLMGIACVFLWLLYVHLQRRYGTPIAALLTAFLALYPPGIYFSLFSISRMFPAYAFLTAVVVLLYANELFQALSWRRVVAALAIAAFAAFLIFARNTNKPIFFALIIALTIKAAVERLNWKAVGVFAVGFFIFFGSVRAAFPALEHSMWHPIFLGLGDLDNKYKIEMRDWAANNAARAANPALRDIPMEIDHHPDYEPTLKKIVVDMIKNDPVWYVRLLVLRFLKVTIMPFQGSWMMGLVAKQPGETIMNARRFSLFVDTLTAVLDLALTLLGTFVLIGLLIKRSWKETLPYVLLVASAVQVYVIVMVSNRTIFLSGTYFYEFFAVLFLSQRLFAAKVRK